MSEQAPRVSVLMAAYNAASFIQEAIDSILQQSFTDFELIVVDDCSQDATCAILAAVTDPRMLVLHAPANLGPAGARNFGFTHVRGEYLAIQDADDISKPERLAVEVAHLDAHPADVLVSADIRKLLPDGRLVSTPFPGPAMQPLLDWMMHLGNPLAFSATMIRVSALRELDQFLREARRYAEDFDLTARLRPLGGAVRLGAPLVTYRVHADNVSSLNRDRMIEQAAHVLSSIWPERLFGAAVRPSFAMLVARHVAGSEPVADRESLLQLRHVLDALLTDFLARHLACGDVARGEIVGYARRVWRNVLRQGLRTGFIGWRDVAAARRGAGLVSVRSVDIARAAVIGRFRRKAQQGSAK